MTYKQKSFPLTLFMLYRARLYLTLLYMKVKQTCSKNKTPMAHTRYNTQIVRGTLNQTECKKQRLQATYLTRTF